VSAKWRVSQMGLPTVLATGQFARPPLLETCCMKTIHAFAAAALAALTALPAAAQFQKNEDAIEYRKSAFFVMGTHFGRIGAMTQGKVPFDGAAAAANAEIVQIMSKLPYAGFVEGTADTKKGSAKANIWTERAKFVEAAKKMQDAVANLAVVAKGNNLESLKTAFGTAGAACKACHDDFRNK
jgi:cytochrome c556